jgi:hypothetical protein
MAAVAAPVPSAVPMPSTTEMASAAEVMTAAKTAVSAEVMAAAAAMAHVMASAAVVASVSRFSDDRHCEHRHQRQHEHEYAFHCGSFYLGVICRWMLRLGAHQRDNNTPTVFAPWGSQVLRQTTN